MTSNKVNLTIYHKLTLSRQQSVLTRGFDQTITSKTTHDMYFYKIVK